MTAKLLPFTCRHMAKQAVIAFGKRVEKFIKCKPDRSIPMLALISNNCFNILASALGTIVGGCGLYGDAGGYATSTDVCRKLVSLSQSRPNYRRALYPKVAYPSSQLAPLLHNTR